MASVTKVVKIVNKLGLHARPAMQFVDVANQFSSNITVRKEGRKPAVADGKSVMQMIVLEAVPGTALKIEADGADAEQAVARLSDLVASKFGED
jgi:phosphocarrier protein